MRLNFKIDRFVYRGRSWLVSSRWGRIALVALAPFIATPEDFEVVRGRSKSLFARIGTLFGPAMSAGTLFALGFSTAAAQLMALAVPDIPGLSGAEYAAAAARNKQLTWILGLTIGSALALFLGLQRWLFHGFCVWFLSKLRLPATRRRLGYFLLMGANLVVWLGVLMFASGWLLPLMSNGKIFHLFDYLEQNSPQAVVMALAVSLLMMRHQRMREISERQMYPSQAARMIVLGLSFAGMILVLMAAGALAPHLG